MFKTCETDFNLERHLIPYLQDCAFFAELSRHLRKAFTRDIPTAAVAYDQRLDEITLFVNPDFMEKLSNWEIRGVLTHEFYHLIFGHLAARRKRPDKMWNIATDLAINSLILENAGRPRDVGDDDKTSRALPQGALIPGQWPVKPDGRSLSKEEKDAMPLAALIAGMPKMKASEWYFQKIMELARKEEQKGSGKKGKGKSQPGEGEPQPGEGNAEGNGGPFDGEDWIDSMDDHGAWDSITEEQREYIAGKVKSLVEKAVRHADQHSKGWGNIPAEIRDDIRRSVSTIINWRMVLRQFIGNLVRGARTSSIKRINRRYPYVHPGVKRGYQAKLLIAMDQSGSVYDQMVEEFFAELSSVTKKVDVTILPFDCYCSEKDLMEWRKGQTPKLSRTKTGGTDFNAPTAIFNDPKNRGRWDGMLIMTDGQAPAPGPARLKRGWVLGQGCKLYFDSNELQIFMTKEHPMSGAWR